MTPKRPEISVPEHLSPVAAAFYRDVCAGYELEPHHFRLLQLAAEAWTECERCQEAIRRDGLSVLDRFGCQQPHPLAKIGQQSRNQFERLCRALALDIDAPIELPRQPRTAIRGRR